ncbi:MAG: hypothetical protein IIB08_08025, partial [Bacteroidetes bacterium]|nr:hypothetical protein [Bacteroidota bacterium]
MTQREKEIIEENLEMAEVLGRKSMLKDVAQYLMEEKGAGLCLDILNKFSDNTYISKVA